MAKIICASIFVASLSLCLANILPEAHGRYLREINSDLKFITNFSWKLFTNSKLDTVESNHVMSPISAQLLLAMLQQTATGETRQQFDNILGIHDLNLISEAMRNLKASRSRNELQSATAMFPLIDYTFNETFTETARKSSVDVIPVNFKDFSPTEQTINKWVSEATKGEIPRIIEPNDDIFDVKLLLLNSIYFRGFWENDFEDEIVDGDFYTKSTESMRVKYMKLYTELKYGEKLSLGDDNLGYRWIELPYENDEYSMFIIMPTQRWGLEALLKVMNENDLERMMDQDISNKYWTQSKVNLRLPKFGIKTTISLIDTLKELGLHDVFNREKSELPYLTSDGKKLFISKAIQQATLNVDEKGTVASAATSIFLMDTFSGPVYMPREDFIVDQPFLSIIVDRKQNLPIFISKIYNPEILS